MLVILIITVMIANALPDKIVMPLLRSTPCANGENNCDFKVLQTLINTYVRNTIVIVESSGNILTKEFKMLANASLVGSIYASDPFEVANITSTQLTNYPMLDGFYFRSNLQSGALDIYNDIIHVKNLTHVLFLVYDWYRRRSLFEYTVMLPHAIYLYLIPLNYVEKYVTNTSLIGYWNQTAIVIYGNESSFNVSRSILEPVPLEYIYGICLLYTSDAADE